MRTWEKTFLLNVTPAFLKGVSKNFSPVGDAAIVVGGLCGPKLLEEAVKSAKKMAEKFAEHAGTKVGDIMKADQGSFSIKSIRGDYNEDAYMQKKVRVVSTITYGLRT